MIQKVHRKYLTVSTSNLNVIMTAFEFVSSNIKVRELNNKYFLIETIFKAGACSNDRGLLDRISLDQNCLFSVDQKFHFQLIKILRLFS
jgi:hypothetical protein